MKRTSTSNRLAVLLLLAWVWVTGGAGGQGRAADLSVARDDKAGSVRITHRGQILMEYAFAASQYKPYVRELREPGGGNVLRDSPPDHLHHHGLMLALRVNGVNFWEEKEPAGRQVAEESPECQVESLPGGGSRATLTQRVRWQPPGESHPERALLREWRRLVLEVQPTGSGVSLDWDSRFQLGPRVDRAVLHGPDYHGLGLRLPESFDHVAVFANSSGLPYTEAQTYDVRPARWTAVTGPLEGREVQVVLVTHVSNPGRHAFFSMRNAFAYLAATPEPARQPLEFRGRDRFAFRHRLWLPGRVLDGPALEAGLRDWLASR